MFHISIMGIIGSVITLSEDPESIPSHGVSGVVVEFINVDLARAVVSGV
jgi:hypothetical protein